jgi:hypothetical protein
MRQIRRAGAAVFGTALLAVMASMYMWGYSPRLGDLIAVAGSIGMLLGGAARFAARALPRRWKERPGGHLAIVRDGLVIERSDGIRLVETKRVQWGYLLEPMTLGLVLADGVELRFALESRREAEDALRSLDLHAATRPLEVRLISAASAGSSIGRVLGLVGVIALAPLVFEVLALTVAALLSVELRVSLSFGLPLLALGGALSALVRYFSPRRAWIGVDGVTLDRFLRRARIMPYSQMASVVEDDWGVALTTRANERVHLRVSREPIEPGRGDDSASRRAAILERIRQARDLAAQSAVADAKLARLDRAGRTPDAWREALRRVRSEDYRMEPFEPDELVRIACDADVSPERRVGATIALHDLDVTSVDRVRVAARACVDDDLRAALEAAADGEITERRLGRANARVRR